MGAKALAARPADLAFYRFVGTRMATMREEFNWTLEELAGKLGVSRSALWYYEVGRSPIPLAVFTRLAIATGVSVDWLLFDRPQENPLLVAPGRRAS